MKSKPPHQSDARKDMRKVRLRILLLAAAIGLGVSAIWLIIFQSNIVFRSNEASLPELLRGLPKDATEADLAFGVRVIDRFPSGMALQEVVHALESQGFRVSADGKSAGFREPGLVCNRLWRVFWVTDETQSILNISGGYQGDVCL